MRTLKLIVALTLISGISAQAASKLGDLTKFRAIVVDVEKLVDQAKLPEAKARIKNLEESWDEAEAGLKSRSPADWHAVDKSIDRTLDALRSSAPNAKECKKDLVELRELMDKMAK